MTPSPSECWRGTRARSAIAARLRATAASACAASGCPGWMQVAAMPAACRCSSSGSSPFYCGCAVGGTDEYFKSLRAGPRLNLTKGIDTGSLRYRRNSARFGITLHSSFSRHPIASMAACAARNSASAVLTLAMAAAASAAAFRVVGCGVPCPVPRPAVRGCPAPKLPGGRGRCAPLGALLLPLSRGAVAFV